MIEGKLIVPGGSAMLSQDFIFGVATSSFQIEGAADRRLPSIWDTFCEKHGKIGDASDGKIACDHYHLWREDVDLIASLGFDAYRFSISWPRVMTEDGSLNPEGIRFYVDLLDRLNEKGVKPFVTLYHWDLPQHLEDAGGWLSRETAYRFRDYVDLVTRAFGDRVHSYATLNEPLCSAFFGYETGTHAPGFKDRALAKQAAHHLLLAHGLAMGVLEQNSPGSINGIVLNFSPCHPATESEADRVAAQTADDEFNQWYVKPLFDGCYPDSIDSLPEREVPKVEDGDMEIISHPLDFLGVNYYTRSVFRAGPGQAFVPVKPVNVPITEMGWEVYPDGLPEILTALNEKYSLPPVYITENGAALPDTLKDCEVDDPERGYYFQDHLEAVNQSIEKGVDIRGYFAWSLMDNFEWAEGYRKRFGLVHVDFETQRRTIKASGKAFGEFLARRRAEAA